MGAGYLRERDGAKDPHARLARARIGATASVECVERTASAPKSIDIESLNRPIFSYRSDAANG